jgi:hypothetical protein
MYMAAVATALGQSGIPFAYWTELTDASAAGHLACCFVDV